jgi:hypothetical protein
MIDEQGGAQPACIADLSEVSEALGCDQLLSRTGY